MSRLLSLRQKIAFIFFVITALAFSAIWFVVVPQLEQNLEERARAARPALELPLLGGRAPTRKYYSGRIRSAADATDARVTVRDWQRDWSPSRNPGFYPVDDSRELVPFNEQLAQRALILRRTEVGYDVFRGEEVGLVAQPLRTSGKRPRVAVYSRDFEDVR